MRPVTGGGCLNSGRYVHFLDAQDCCSQSCANAELQCAEGAQDTVRDGRCAVLIFIEGELQWRGLFEVLKSGNKLGTCGRAIFLLLASVVLAPVTISQVSAGSATARTEPPPLGAYAGNAAARSAIARNRSSTGSRHTLGIPRRPPRSISSAAFALDTTSFKPRTPISS